MKNVRSSLFALMAFAVLGCSKSDDSDGQKENVHNQPPQAFELTATNGTDGVDVFPDLTWEAADDPDGDVVSYDVYLDTSEDPEYLYASRLMTTAVAGAERLGFLTSYHWKVVAKDEEGATTESSIFTFTTRGLRSGETPVTEAAGFSPRTSLSSQAFKNKLWVIGGRDAAGFQEEVWSTSDGLNWSMLTENPGFLGRSSHATAVFQDRLWVLGGTSIREVQPTPENPSGDEKYFMQDVWSSANGSDWEEVTATTAFGVRDGLTTAVLGDKLFIIGGYDGDFKNDVWSTTDGAIWQEETVSAGFSARSGHATVVFDDKIWVIGGWDGTRRLNDVWNSTDGVTWTQVTESAEFSGRVNTSAVVFDNEIWVIGGFSPSASNDIWYSADGVTWAEASVGPTFSGRGEHTTAVYDDKIWVIGGAEGDVRYNDVWILD